MTSKLTRKSCWLLKMIAAAAVVTVFVVSGSYASITKSEKNCENSAYNYFKNKGYAKMKCGKTTHYSVKTSACYVHLVCESDRGKKVAEYLDDVYKSKNHGKYVNSRPSTTSGSCVVDGKKCKDYYEFHDLIKPYLED
jgi:hypothetical protein